MVSNAELHLLERLMEPCLILDNNHGDAIWVYHI